MLSYLKQNQAAIRVLAYSLAVYAFTYAFGRWLILSRGIDLEVIAVLRHWAPLILMWIPGLLSLLFRVLTREGFQDVGFKLGRYPFWLIALLVPFLVAAFTYTCASLIGKVTFNPGSLQGAMFQDPFGFLPSLGQPLPQILSLSGS